MPKVRLHLDMLMTQVNIQTAQEGGVGQVQFLVTPTG